MPSKKHKKKPAAASSAAAGLSLAGLVLDPSTTTKNGNSSSTSNGPTGLDVKGSDDVGNFYSSLEELADVQRLHRDEWYAANQKYWQDGGYGGLTDDEAMIGDTGGGEDGEEGLEFLDRVLAIRRTTYKSVRAIDAGAGVGRVTKLVLLKRYEEVRLVEGDEHFSKRSRAYLGRKRAARCQFTCARLEDLHGNVVAGWDGLVDLVWVQWTLQYLTDLDAEITLRTLARGLVPKTGFLIVKENRPYGGARTDRFQMETPKCSGRYDIVRTDKQLRLIFHKAGLTVDMMQEDAETNTYAVYVPTIAAA